MQQLAYLRITLISLMLCGLLILLARWSLQQDLHHQLQAQLPASLQAALTNAHDARQTLADISRQLENATQLGCSGRAGVNLFRECALKNVQLEMQNQVEKSTRSGEFFIPLAGQYLHLSLQLHTALNWPVLGGCAILFALLQILLQRLLPDGGLLHIQNWRNRLQAQGVSSQHASELLRQHPLPNARLALAETLGTEDELGQLPAGQCLSLAQDAQVNTLESAQLPWLRAALLAGHDLPDALHIARAESQLIFDLAANRVLVHGLPVVLPRTPLFYFYWYAKRRVQGLPAYVNPAQQRPDRHEGEALASLMQQWQGHSKAINDLQENGLKGKTLDQNRNKIKDELHARLGELAAPYLFSAERDQATARYRYALLLAPQQILLSPGGAEKDISEITERCN